MGESTTRTRARTKAKPYTSSATGAVVGGLLQSHSMLESAHTEESRGARDRGQEQESFRRRRATGWSECNASTLKESNAAPIDWGAKKR
eukprot:2607751-Amphidinium_carterae.2